MTTLSVLVDQAAAEGPDQPVGPGVAVAGGVAEGHAARQAALLQGLSAQLQEVVGVVREAVEARVLHRLDPVVDVVAADTQRQRHPAAVPVAVARRRVVPAAVLLTQVIGHVGHVQQLLGQQVGDCLGAPDHVRPGAAEGGGRGLGLDVVDELLVQADLDAGRRGEGGDVLVELDVLGLDEAVPAQHAQRSTVLRLEGAVGRPGPGPIEQRRAGQCGTGGNCSRALQNTASADVLGHGVSSLVVVALGLGIFIAGGARSRRRRGGPARGWARARCAHQA